jgi:alpha-tubulin suppressor-like RCC1 family protein
MLNVLLLALPMVASTGQASDTLEFMTLAAGGSHTCGIAKSKATYCWGSNQYGQIGDGKRTGQQDPNKYPTLVLGDHQFASLALGSRFTCGLTHQGKAYCWGYNFDGQVGDGTTTGQKFAPTAVKTDQTFESIVAGHFHVCALTGEGDAYCWGNSGSGQVGDGRSWNRQNIADEPTMVVGGHTFNQLMAAFDFSCGLEGTGGVYCWGGVDLTEYTDSIYRRPALVSKGKTFNLIFGTGDHLCALIQQVAWCWGQNRQGQLGDSTWTRRNEPTAVVGGLKFFQLTAGPVHTCGITSAGKAYCWGEDHVGQLGTGGREYRGQGQPWPLEVYGGLPFTQIVAGGTHTCAIEVGGRAYCWGDNRQSQIGQERTKFNYRNWPQLILGEAADPE